MSLILRVALLLCLSTLPVRADELPPGSAVMERLLMSRQGWTLFTNVTQFTIDVPLGRATTGWGFVGLGGRLNYSDTLQDVNGVPPYMEFQLSWLPDLLIADYLKQTAFGPQGFAPGLSGSSSGYLGAFVTSQFGLWHKQVGPVAIGLGGSGGLHITNGKLPDEGMTLGLGPSARISYAAVEWLGLRASAGYDLGLFRLDVTRVGNSFSAGYAAVPPASIFTWALEVWTRAGFVVELRGWSQRSALSRLAVLDRLELRVGWTFGVGDRPMGQK